MLEAVLLGMLLGWIIVMMVVCLIAGLFAVKVHDATDNDR